jgi:hypothetical protein
VVTREI